MHKGTISKMAWSTKQFQNTRQPTTVLISCIINWSRLNSAFSNTQLNEEEFRGGHKDLGKQSGYNVPTWLSIHVLYIPSTPIYRTIGCSCRSSTIQHVQDKYCWLVGNTLILNVLAQSTILWTKQQQFTSSSAEDPKAYQKMWCYSFCEHHG